MKGVELDAKIVSVEHTNAKSDLIEYKCLCCIKNYRKTFDENLKNRFNIYKFTLLLRNVYPYEYLDDEKNLLSEQHYLKNKIFTFT